MSDQGIYWEDCPLTLQGLFCPITQLFFSFNLTGVLTIFPERAFLTDEVSWRSSHYLDFSWWRYRTHHSEIFYSSSDYGITLN